MARFLAQVVLLALVGCGGVKEVSESCVFRGCPTGHDCVEVGGTKYLPGIMKCVPLVPPTIPSPTPTPTAEPTQAPTPEPSQSPATCISKCPQDSWRCAEKVAWEVRQGNWKAECSKDGDGPKRLMAPGGWRECPTGQRVFQIYGCPPGIPDSPTCEGKVCLDMKCRRIDCATRAVIYEADSGWFGKICDPKVIPCR